jgi:hypothetical protein
MRVVITRAVARMGGSVIRISLEELHGLEEPHRTAAPLPELRAAE